MSVISVKFDVYFKRELGTLFKSNEVDLDGLEANVNLDLELVESMKVNYLINGNKLTDDIAIKDIEKRLILIPFKSEVRVTDTKIKFEIQANMKNGDVKVSQTYVYDVEMGIGEGTQVGTGGSGDGHTHNNLSTLHKITEAKIKAWDAKSDFSGSYNDLTNKPTIPTVDVTKVYVDSEVSKKADKTHSHSEYATPSYVQEKIAEASLSGGEVDLSAYATKAELNTKADKSHTHNELHSHSNKMVLDEITSSKVNEWNNKSTFNGDYNSLTNKPVIPSTEGLATETYVQEKIAEASLNGGEVDLSDYATKEYVNIKVTENTDKITVLSDEVVEIEKELTATRKLVTGELVDLEGVLLENAPDYLKIPTYDGSDQIVHCKVLYFKNKWNGYKFWMGHTPLPYIPSVDESKENPCIMVSDDGENWLTPQGLTNPLDLPTNYPNDYLSDTHLVYIPHTDTLEIWYRQYIKSPTTEVIWRRTSKDGVNWTEKEEVMRSNSTNSIVSPTVIYDENKYKIWFVGNTSAGYELRYFESDNGLNPIHIRDMNIGNLNLGHCDVIKTTKGYECVCHIRGDQYCVYSHSEDNLNWSSCTEILKVSNSWDNNKLYRPSLTVVDNQYYFYYAGGLSTQGAKIGLIKVDGEEGLLAKNIIQDEDNMFLNKTLYNKLANLDVDDILNRLVLLEKASNDGVIRVQGITLDVKTHSIGLNETIQLNPAIMPPDATNQTIIWSASNDNCSVDNGVVTAKAPGVCVITAKTQDGGYTDSCDILVSESADGSFQDSLILHLDSTIKGDVVGHWMDLSPKQQTVLLENFTNDGINDGFIDGALKLNDQALTRIKIKDIKDHFKKDLTLHIKYNAEKTIGKIFGNNYMTTSSCAVPNTKVVYWRGNKSYEPQGASFEVGVDTEFTITHNVTSGELKIYKDKMNIFTGTLPSTDSLTTGDLYIGASDIQHGATNHFKGKIYSVKMFNTVLTPEEVQSL